MMNSSFIISSFFPSEDISLSFRDISYQVKPVTRYCKTTAGKQILQGVSGNVPAGSFLAILGPSGAGKSTLLDVLAGREKAGTISGAIRFNGEKRPHDFLQRSAYVMQEDTMLGNLTVKETLKYALDLRVPSSVLNKQEKQLRIDSLLKDLNLTKVANSRVGTPTKRGISGGERRRLSIGVELVTGPKIVYLDEPTTGLDSTNALRVMKSLKNLCEKYKVTVICTIHQPRSNIFYLFDYLLLLSEGRMIYYGKALHSVSYFEKLGLKCPKYMNPADYLLDLLEEKDDDEDEGEDNAKVLENKLLLSQAPKYGAIQSINNDDHSNYHRSESDEENDKEEMEKAKLSRDQFRSQNLPEKFLQSKEYQELDQLTTSLHQKKVQSFDNLQKLENPNAMGNNEMEVFEERIPQVSTFVQMITLLSRVWFNTIRDSNIMYIRTIAALAVALLVGIMFFQSSSTNDGQIINSILFLMCVFALFVLPSISKFIEERAIFTREHASGYYGTSPYLFANFFVEIPILAFTVLAYGSISYWMVGYRANARDFFFYLAVIFVVIQVGYGACQFIASIVSTINVAVAIYIIFLVYSLLLGGFIIPQDQIPENLQWLVYSSYFYYGFAALMVNEYKDSYYYGDPIGESELIGLGLENTNKYYCFLVLFFAWIVLKIFEYFGLRFVNKELR